MKLKKKNGVIARTIGKKSEIIKAISTMNNDELFLFNGFLVDVLTICTNEMRNRSKE
jgi:hypothetical protein